MKETLGTARDLTRRGPAERGATLRSAHRSAAPVRQQEYRTVPDSELGERRRFVENLPTAELEHEIGVELGLGEERLECADFHGEDRFPRRGDDSHGVPDLRHLDAKRDARRALRKETNRGRARTELSDEGLRHRASGSAGSVEKKRATCMSKR